MTVRKVVVIAENIMYCMLENVQSYKKSADITCIAVYDNSPVAR